MTGHRIKNIGQKRGDNMKKYKRLRVVVAKAKTKTYAYGQCACNCQCVNLESTLIE